MAHPAIGLPKISFNSPASVSVSGVRNLKNLDINVPCQIYSDLHSDNAFHVLLSPEASGTVEISYNGQMLENGRFEATSVGGTAFNPTPAQVADENNQTALFQTLAENWSKCLEAYGRPVSAEELLPSLTLFGVRLCEIFRSQIANHKLKANVVLAAEGTIDEPLRDTHQYFTKEYIESTTNEITFYQPWGVTLSTESYVELCKNTLEPVNREYYKMDKGGVYKKVNFDTKMFESHQQDLQQHFNRIQKGKLPRGKIPSVWLTAPRAEVAAALNEEDWKPLNQPSDAIATPHSHQINNSQQWTTILRFNNDTIPIPLHIVTNLIFNLTQHMAPEEVIVSIRVVADLKWAKRNGILCDQYCSLKSDESYVRMKLIPKPKNVNVVFY